MARPQIRALYVDYSVGFGGATKSTALVLRRMPDVAPIILTCQLPDVREHWYAGYPVIPFRERMNYRGREIFCKWVDEKVPTASARWLFKKADVIADVGVEWLNVIRIYSLIKKHDLQMVHLNNGILPTEALIAAKLARVPSIAYLRGFFDWNDATARRNAAMVTVVIGDSNAVTASFNAQLSDSPLASTIYECVDVEAFDRTAHLRALTRERWRIADDDIAVGLFGRFIPWKGQREFVLAMLEALRANPRLKGCIIGDASDGTSSYQADVIQLIRNSGFQHRFVLTGYRAEVEPLNAAMDIVVHASVEPEPCGMVVLEGMAAKRPVIAIAAGGPLELIQDGVYGRLVPPLQPPAMASAILDLAADRGRREHMGALAHAAARARFDVEVIAGETLAMYRRVLSEYGTR